MGLNLILEAPIAGDTGGSSCGFRHHALRSTQWLLESDLVIGCLGL